MEVEESPDGTFAFVAAEKTIEIGCNNAVSKKLIEKKLADAYLEIRALERKMQLVLMECVRLVKAHFDLRAVFKNADGEVLRDVPFDALPSTIKTIIGRYVYLPRIANKHTDGEEEEEEDEGEEGEDGDEGEEEGEEGEEGEEEEVGSEDEYEQESESSEEESEDDSDDSDADSESYDSNESD